MNRQIIAQASVGLIRSGILSNTAPVAATLSRRSMFSTSRAVWAQTNTGPLPEADKFEAAKKICDEMDQSAAALKTKLDSVKEPAESVKDSEGGELTEEERKARETEAERLAEQAAASEKLWNILVPERNMGLTSPAFLILLVLTILLHMYNNHMDAEMDEIMKKKRILRIKREKLEREGKVDMTYFQPIQDEDATEQVDDSTTDIVSSTTDNGPNQ